MENGETNIVLINELETNLRKLQSRHDGGLRKFRTSLKKRLPRKTKKKLKRKLGKAFRVTLNHGLVIDESWSVQDDIKNGAYPRPLFKRNKNKRTTKTI